MSASALIAIGVALAVSFGLLFFASRTEKN